MITFQLKKDESKSKYWNCTLPTYFEGAIDVTLRKLKVDPYTMDENCLVVGVKTNLPFQHLIGTKINLHEAYFLFSRMESFTDVGLAKFSTVVKSGKHSEDHPTASYLRENGPYSIKEMINLTYNMDCFKCEDMAKGYIDSSWKFKIISEPDMNIYDGKCLPPLYRSDYSMLLVKMTSRENPERYTYRYLPIDTDLIRQSYQLIGCNSLEECSFEYYNCGLEPNFADDLIRNNSFSEIAEICQDKNNHNQRMKLLLPYDIKPEDLIPIGSDQPDLGMSL